MTNEKKIKIGDLILNYNQLSVIKGENQMFEKIFGKKKSIQRSLVRNFILMKQPKKLLLEIMIQNQKQREKMRQES